MSSGRRGGIPGPESRTGLVRPAMTEAEFERRVSGADVNRGSSVLEAASAAWSQASQGSAESASEGESGATAVSTSEPETTPRASGRGRGSRSKPSKPRRVQRMFAIEEELDKKLWLYAIHVGKDRSDVVNDLLRPLVGSMVLYDSRERRSGRNNDNDGDA